MKSNRNKKEYSRLLIAIITLLVLVGGYVLLWTILEASREDVQEQRQLLYSKTNIKTSTVTASDLLRRTEVSRAQINERLLKRENFIAFIEEIETIARVSNVELKKELPSQSDKVIFKLAITGSFENCMYFLRLIETVPYRVKVQRSYLEQVHEASDTVEAEWRGSIDVLVYGYNLTL